MERDDARAVVAAFFPKHQAGDREATATLVASVSGELRRMAREQAGRGGMLPPGDERRLQSLYADLLAEAGLPPQDRAPFLLICARAMRLVVVDYLRTPDGLADPRSSLVLAVHDLLDAIERFNPRIVRVVEALYFAGLGEDEASRGLRVDTAELRRDWKRARAWLVKELPSYAPAAGERDVSVANAAWVDAILDDALALPADERAAFLDRCSAVSPNLRRDVDELLRLADQALPGFEPGGLPRDLLWTMVAGAAPAGIPVEPESVEPAEPPAAAPPFEIPFETPDRAGSGGVDEGTGPAAPATDADRILPELRRLTHPAIAAVTGSTRADDGRESLLFERVEGRPIDRYCDDELLTIDERLDLFLTLCGAVQHGHRKLIAHGAIEPAAVLVTPGREVKLLGYGMARLGWGPSPEYATPEHIAGEAVTVASDVYQLGLLLYELLTGERAHAARRPSQGPLARAGGTSQVVRPSVRVRHAPEKHAAARRLRPRALSRTLRGDLDAIVMYALRRKPERRYPSVSALRSDVQRYRARRPVWVRSHSAWYRAGKFIGRQRVPLSAALLAVAVGATMLPGPVVDRLREDEENARVARVEQVLGDMLGPTMGPGGEQPPNALQFLEQSERVARAELADEPRSRARLLTTIGRAYAALGQYERSIGTLDEALGLRRSHFGDDSLEVAETLEALARSEHLVGRYDEAEASLRSVLAVRQVRAGGEHPSTVDVAVELGSLLHSRGQLREAEQLLRGAVTRLRTGLRMATTDAPAATLLPRALLDLAAVLRDRGLPGESAGLYREAIALLKQPGRGGSPPLAVARAGYAQLLVGRGEFDEADAELGEALPALRQAHPGDHPEVAHGLYVLALLRMEQGKLDDAGSLVAEARRIQEKALGRIHPTVPRTRALEAELARRRGQVAEAIAGARRALEQLDRLGLAEHQAAVDARLTLGEALMAAGQHEEAMGVLASGLPAAERLFVRFDPRLTRIQEAMTRAARGSVIRPRERP